MLTAVPPAAPEGDSASLGALIVRHDGDDVALLHALSAHVQAVKAEYDKALAARNTVALRMRARGVSNVFLANVTGLTDSYFARLGLRAGQERRRTDRRAVA